MGFKIKTENGVKLLLKCFLPAFISRHKEKLINNKTDRIKKFQFLKSGYFFHRHPEHLF